MFAEFIKNVDFGNKAELYKIDTPFIQEPRWEGDERIETEYLISSTASIFGVETLVFPATEKGEVINFGDIGGRKGLADPATAIEEMGYVIK